MSIFNLYSLGSAYILRLLISHWPIFTLYILIINYNFFFFISKNFFKNNNIIYVNYYH